MTNLIHEYECVNMSPVAGPLKDESGEKFVGRMLLKARQHVESIENSTVEYLLPANKNVINKLILSTNRTHKQALLTLGGELSRAAKTSPTLNEAAKLLENPQAINQLSRLFAYKSIEIAALVDQQTKLQQKLDKLLEQQQDNTSAWSPELNTIKAELAKVNAKIDPIIANIKAVNPQADTKELLTAINETKRKVLETFSAPDYQLQTKIFEALVPDQKRQSMMGVLNNTTQNLKENIAILASNFAREEKSTDKKVTGYMKKVAFETEKTLRSLAMHTPAILHGNTDSFKKSVQEIEQYQQACQNESWPRKVVDGCKVIARGMVGSVVFIACMSGASALLGPLAGGVIGLSASYITHRAISPVFDKVADWVKERIPKIVSQPKTYNQAERVTKSISVSMHTLSKQLSQLETAKDVKKLIDPEDKRKQLMKTLSESLDRMEMSMLHIQAVIKEQTINGNKIVNSKNGIFKEFIGRIEHIREELKFGAVNFSKYNRLLNEINQFETLINVLDKNIEALTKGDCAAIDEVASAVKRYQHKSINDTTNKNFISALGHEGILFTRAGVQTVMTRVAAVCVTNLIHGAVKTSGHLVPGGALIARFACAIPSYLIAEKLEEKVEHSLQDWLTSKKFDTTLNEKDNQRVRNVCGHFSGLLAAAKKEASNSRDMAKKIEQPKDKVTVGNVLQKNLNGLSTVVKTAASTPADIELPRSLAHGVR